jgi:hypothetical protein
MINYIPYGNIFNITGVNSYAHGCNCVGAMGKGIAVQFRQKFPDMFIIYHEMCQKKKFCPGDVYAYEYEPGKFVFNLATQEHYNPCFGRLARIEWISASVEKMIKDEDKKITVKTTDLNSSQAMDTSGSILF